VNYLFPLLCAALRQRIYGWSIEEARKGLKEQAQELERLASIEAYLLEMTNKSSSVADITTAILSQNEKLAKENALLHEKLDRSNELLVAAKKGP
jgi:hypothetical protein